MAGGGGARLWPASVPERPKQLLDPLLESPPSSYATSLLARTVERIRPLIDRDDIWVVTHTEQAEGAHRALPELTEQHILSEPHGRNTAPAIALFAVHVRAHCPSDDPTLLIFPADHHVSTRGSFEHGLRTACAHAELADAMVSLGITPTEASAGYGYIERGMEPVAPVSALESSAVYPVTRFIEKPSAERARELLAGGRFLWNSGIFVTRLSRLERELQHHCPDLWQALRPVAVALGQGDPLRLREATQAAYASISAQSIDVAVMERATGLRVVPATFEWTDLGTWQAVYELAAKDEHGNVELSAGPRPLLIDTQRCLAWGDSAQIAVIGLEDILVVQCGDRVLVAPRSRAQDVRQIVHDLLEREERKP